MEFTLIIKDNSDENSLLKTIHLNVEKLTITYPNYCLHHYNSEYRDYLSNVLNFLILNKFPNLRSLIIKNALIKVDSLKDMENILDKFSSNFQQLISLDFGCTFLNYNDESYEERSFCYAVYGVETQYWNEKVNYKVEGNLDIILKFINSFQNLKHFGVDCIPYKYIIKIIKCTNIETLRKEITFYDKGTLNYMRTNKYF